MVGVLLLLASLPFALGTILPHGAIRLWVLRGGVAAVWAVGALGGPLLVLGLVILSVQRPFLVAVFASHLAGLALLLLAVYLAGYRLLR
jgi:hypothetical protein